MNTTKVSICQSNYIPWRGYFDLIGLVDTFIIYDNVQYTKNDWRNRNRIKTLNGAEWITIPVKSNTLNQKINETHITLNNWNIKHWRTLNTNYAKAKHYKGVSSFIEDIYLNQLNGVTSLSEINTTLIKNICEYLGIKTKIYRDTDFVLKEGKTEKLLDLCKQLNASSYLSGPAAKDYLDTQLFTEHNVEVQWMNYENYPDYTQLHGEFNPNISILDLLFNQGPNAYKFLKFSYK